MGTFDVLPILQLLWLYRRSGLNVSFSDSEVPDNQDPYPYGLEDTAQNNLKAMNQSLVCLASTTILDIKAYTQYPRLLETLFLYTSGSAGSINYYSPTSYSLSNDLRTTFKVVDGAINLFTKTKEPTVLTTLIRHNGVHNTLIKMLVPQDTVITYNVGKRTIIPALPTVFAINHRIRNNGYGYYRSNRFHAKFTASELKTSFAGEFKLLGEWKRPNSRPEGNPETLPRPHSIVLDFTSASPVTLEELQINVTDLIVATRHYLTCPYKTQVLTQIMLTSQLVDVDQKSFTVQLSDIQEGALVTLDATFRSNSADEDLDFPMIWMDGRGAIREIDEYSESQRVRNIECDGFNLSQTIIRKKAMNIATRYHMKPVYTPRVEGTLGALIALLASVVEKEY